MLSTGLDALRPFWVEGQISPGVAAELRDAIYGARRVAQREAFDIAAMDAFEGLLLLVDAWASPEEHVQYSLWAPALQARRGPGVAIAKKLAHVLQNEAHNLSLRQEIAALGERPKSGASTARRRGYPVATDPRSSLESVSVTYWFNWLRRQDSNLRPID